MLLDLAFYAELLIPLAGSFMYGFLARELLRQKTILPGNLPVRLLAASLTLWYAGSLLDELAFILYPSSAWWQSVGPVVDVLRSFGWLSSFPFLAHTVWEMSGRERPTGWWLVPGYASLAAFAPAALHVLIRGETALTRVSRDLYGLVVVHVSVSTVIALGLVLATRARSQQEFARFFRWLLVALLALEALVLLGASVLDIWSEPLWRILVSSSGLVVGATFLYFVRRYNLLKLSLSNRSLRHFALIVGLLFLVLLGGPVLGASGHPVFHRVIAWGIVVAILAGLLLSPLTRWVSRRSPELARLFRRGIPHEKLASLSDGIRNLDLSEGELKSFVALSIGEWTGTAARFAPANESFHAALSEHFRDSRSEAFNRLHAPTPALAGVLATHELHAVFPLRVGGELDETLVIPTSVIGGGYEDGEMESIRLGLDQLGAALEIRRLAAARLAAERRLSDQERLSMLGMVSASLAHELKNPLSSMKALAQTVREELHREDPDSEHAKDLTVIVEQVDRLSEVAHEILGFARPQPDATSANVAHVVASAAYVLDHEARRRGIAIERLVNDDCGQTPGTPATWQTIVFNLMVNAVRHAPDGSTVKLRLARKDHHLTFECENAGEPLDDEVVSELFSPFVLGGKKPADPSSTGLGLALVSQRVEELGGTVGLTGEAGRIVFRVEVPVDG